MEELRKNSELAFEKNANLKSMMNAINKSGFAQQQMVGEAMTKAFAQMLTEKLHR